MDMMVPAAMNCEANENVSVVPTRPTDWAVSVTGEKEGCQALTVPSPGVPPVPGGTDMVTDERAPAVTVVSAYVYDVPAVLIWAAVGDHDTLLSVPSALAGRGEMSVLDMATNSAISTTSVVRPRLTKRRRGRLSGRLAHACTVW
jgi:hypothetical protein